MKKAVLLLLSCCTYSIASSQHLMYAIGSSYFIDHANHSKGITSSSIAFSPRYNITEHDYYSLSVGLPINIGAVIDLRSSEDSYDYNYTDKIRMLIDVPVILNFNLGAISSAENTQKVGGFVGAGMAYHLGPVTKIRKGQNGIDDYNPTTQGSAGPVINAGIRLNIRQAGINGLEIKGTYMKSYINQTDVYSIQLLYAM
ncbi:hypothetical protein DVR12_13120 [Chitinophaga silvatica]|uniref:Outer membrane protein beta-barrel domain-containing protein n=1 Tax=Chitinophaga silvatica TaxID=2282649 RepID=A0A3E1YAI5_9BACT|nr:hypothetical protein [Chitinophaga silvatica]RFS22729.1 hypothetical protein DVR12_13120 [Chitinophaga silvatica]